MAFPPVRTFIGFPYAATPSISAGADFRAIYWPLGNLTDGSAKTAWRSANTTGAVILDLGSAQPCNFFACFGHNFAPDLVLSVQMSNSLTMTPTVLSRGVGVKQPSFWLDLRTLTGLPTTARYVQLAWTANNRAATIGELCVGLATEFKGMLDAEPVERLDTFQQRAALEYGQLVISTPGSLSRTMDLMLSLDVDQRAALDLISATAATSSISQPGDGTRVVVVPSTHRNDAWYVEWPALIEQTFERSDRIVRAPLPLIEEVFGVR